MRNLKRALSLALASVMLLGMMVIGTSAATFTDADEIVNTEAATITAGLGLFAGSEGKFNPAGTVTRAQMATVIVKMLYGSEINADSYKGSGKFSDVASFEGGWAEGYINLCANLGIVGGYGDGTFKPGQYLTTAEAVTMLLNALKVDAGEGTWPLTVMAAAEKIELYKDMLTAKPTTNEALTRDQLSVLVWNGLNYSADEKIGYTVNGVTYSDYMEAFLAAGGTLGGQQPNQTITIAKPDTLADSVFGLKKVEGILTGNTATGEDYTVVGGEEYNVETGLELIGHKVTVYFESEVKSDKDLGVAYAVVDQNKTVVVAQPDGAIDSRSEYRAAFGSKAITVAQNVATYRNYNIVAANTTNIGNVDVDTAAGDYTVPNGTYVIDEDTNTVIAYHAPAVTEVSIVDKIVTTAGKESIKISGINNNTALANTEDEDVVVEYDGIAEEDLVAVTKQGALYIVEKLDTVNGIVTAQSANKDNGATILTIGGTKYTFFATANGQDNTNAILTNEIETDFTATALFNKEHTFYLTNGKLVGYSAVAGSANVSDVIFVVNVYEVETKDAYGQETRYVYAQGVDMDGKEVNVLVDVLKKEGNNFVSVLTADDANDPDQAIDKVLTAGSDSTFYTFEKCGETEGNKYGIMTAIEVGTEQDAELTQVDVAYVQDSDLNKITAASKRINVENNEIAYMSANAKLIKVIGSGATIETALSESMKYTVKNSQTEAAYALVSLDDNGNMTVEVIVAASTESISTAEDVIFVTSDQTSFVSATAIGKIFEVYNAKTGELIELTIDGSSINAGFYEYSYDETEKLHSIGDQMGTNNGYYAGVSFDKVYNGMITAGNTIVDWDASNAIIVDIRSEDDIDASDWAKIETLNDMVYTEKENGGNAQLTLSIVASEDADDAIVYVIYVVDIQANQNP